MKKCLLFLATLFFCAIACAQEQTKEHKPFFNWFVDLGIEWDMTKQQVEDSLRKNYIPYIDYGDNGILTVGEKIQEIGYSFNAMFAFVDNRLNSAGFMYFYSSKDDAQKFVDRLNEEVGEFSVTDSGWGWADPQGRYCVLISFDVKNSAIEMMFIGPPTEE